ncbi:MAG: hypothetical protein AAF517_08545 [Planctomycetota bacterium]
MLRRIIVALAIALPATVLAHDWNGLTIDAKGSLFSIDAEDGQAWRIDPDGKVAVFLPGTKDPKRCRHPHHLVLDTTGRFWIPSG